MHPSLVALAPLALGLALVASCNDDGKPVVELPDPGDADAEECPVDASVDRASAYDAGLDTEVSETLCPRRDQDFWRFQITEPGQLAEIEVAYDKLANMQLAVDWYGPEGACMQESPTPCDGGACPDQLVCDTARGGCRRAAVGERCSADAHCQTGERCVAAPTTLATVADPNASGTMHRVHTVLPALMAGEYVVTVSDKLDMVSDPNVRYGLRVRTLAEPDTQEPNDTPNMATPLTSATAVTGYLSHQNRGDALAAADRSDIDWYVITPTFATRPIVIVDLTWPIDSTIDPTWRIVQGDFTLDSPRVRETGDDASGTKTRRAAVIAPAAGPVMVRVSNLSPSFDTETPYTLTVTLAEDTSEPTTRNDTPREAQSFAAGLPSAGNSFSYTGTIAAENDQDWFRVDIDPATVGNSLLHILAKTDAPTEAYLLEMTIYAASTKSCTRDADCGTSGWCMGPTTCITPWVQRPSPSGPGDPQRGGLSPNRLETQLPVFRHGDGSLYVVVRHNTSTFLDLPGYSTSNTYTISMTHKEEPDATDRDDPDNKFVALPLAPNLDRDDFLDHARQVQAGDVTLTPGTGGRDFATLAPGSKAVVGSCADLTVLAFNAQGEAATGTTVVALSAAAGALVDNCTDQVPLAAPLTVTGASGTVSYVAPAAASVNNTIVVGIDGLTVTNISNWVPAVANNTVQSLRLVNPTGGEFLRRQAVGAASQVRIELPADVSTPIRVRLYPVRGQVGCTNVQGGACVGASLVPSTATACTPTFSGTCDIVIASGRTYDLRFRPTTAGVVALSANPLAQNLFYGTTMVMSAGPGGTLETAVPLEGYLSYDGDQDFFSIPLSSLPAAGMTLWVDLAAPSPLDIRVAASRGQRGAFLAANTDDTCAGGCDDGTCDDRQQCGHGVYSAQTGVEATPTGTCVYVDEPADTLDVWVNDINANDWDEVTKYQIRVRLAGGCPAICGVIDPETNNSVCGQ